MSSVSDDLVMVGQSEALPMIRPFGALFRPAREVYHQGLLRELN